MPKMFELYVYAGFLNGNSSLSASNFNYQFSTHGNSLDFLICDEDSKTKIVIDTKYKLRYNYGQIHGDIRQVAGYARLNKVKNEASNVSREIPCLIIYPKPIENEKEDKISLNIKDLLATKIVAYHEVYKLGINLPLMD